MLDIKKNCAPRPSLNRRSVDQRTVVTTDHVNQVLRVRARGEAEECRRTAMNDERRATSDEQRATRDERRATSDERPSTPFGGSAHSAT